MCGQGGDWRHIADDLNEWLIFDSAALLLDLEVFGEEGRLGEFFGLDCEHKSQSNNHENIFIFILPATK